MSTPRAPEIIEQPPSAIAVVAEAAGIPLHEAKAVLKALIKAGFMVAPLEPTNTMFGAYIEALGAPAKNHNSVIRNIGKARRRWKAMATAGLKVAFSNFALRASKRSAHALDVSPRPAPDRGGVT